MRILHFAHSFFPIYGGTSTRLFNLLSNPVNDHFLHVLHPSSILEGINAQAIDNSTFYNIKVRRIKLKDSFFLNLPIVNSFCIFNSIINKSNTLLNAVRDNNIDISHGHNPIIFGTAAMKYAMKMKIPFIYEAHLFGSDIYLNGYWRYLPNHISYFIKKPDILFEKKIYNFANVIIAQTDNIKKRMINFFKIKEHKIKVIPMGVDEDLFNPGHWKKKSEKLKEEKKWKDKIIIMYNGYLSDSNGIFLLFKAIRDLPENIKNMIKIIIMGRGPLQYVVEDMAKKYPNLIDFLGLIEYKKMPLFYKVSDIVINPRLPIRTVMDNVPTKMLEAMSMENIVLGSNINSINEIIRDGYNGFLFERGNFKDLIDKLIYIIENFYSIKGVGEQARKDVIKSYRWQEKRIKLQKIYNNIHK